MVQSSRRDATPRAGAATPSSPSTPKHAIARMRSSLVSIHGGDPRQPIGSGVVIRAKSADDGIVATALHVVRDVATDELQIGLPVPPSEQLRGGLTMLGAAMVATDEGNDLALLRMADTAPLTDGVAHPSAGRYPVTVAELDAERPEDGEDVMISGFPLGYRDVLHSSGIIASAWGDQGIHRSPEHREPGRATGARLDRYLVDINVNPGNSGGPCYRVADQRVLGICEAIELVEVAFEDTRRDVDGERDVGDDALPVVAEVQPAVLQKADITFVVPAKYVIALLETV